MKTPQLAPMAGMSPLGLTKRETELSAQIASRQYALIAETKARDEKTIAERKWSAPLKPRAEQKACDAGLFSDDSKQTEMKL